MPGYTGTPCARCGDIRMRHPPLSTEIGHAFVSAAQLKLLDKLAARGGSAYIRGAEVQTARRLEELGLVRLEDYGEMILDGRSDNERWSAELVEPVTVANPEGDQKP